MNPSIRSPDFPRWSILFIILVVSLVLSMMPFGYILLYPFKLFTTWAHECGHGLMAVLIGGEVKSIVIDPSTAGLTQSLIPSSAFARALVASAGYMGAASFGCLLLVATRLRRLENFLLGLIGLLMIASLIFWIRNLFGVFAVVAMAAGFIYIAKRFKGGASRFFLSLLAVQVGLNALFDIRVLFLLGAGEHSDAATMASLTFLPAWLWAGLWMVMSIGALFITIRLTHENVSST